MNAKLKQLRDLVVAMDLNDRNVRKLPPDDYRDAAKRALLLTHEEMGLLPMADFAGPISALQTLAENIYFKVHGRFADLDSTGRASVAKTEARDKHLEGQARRERCLAHRDTHHGGQAEEGQ